MAGDVMKDVHPSSAYRGGITETNAFPPKKAFGDTHAKKVAVTMTCAYYAARAKFSSNRSQKVYFKTILLIWSKLVKH